MAENMQFIRVDHDKNLLYETYRLRYNIYCYESNFLDPNDYPDGLETDKYDDYSAHFAAISSEGDIVGTIRLVLESPCGYPIEEHSSNLAITPRSLINQNVIEVSRFAVSKQYQRGIEERLHSMPPSPHYSKSEQLVNKVLPLQKQNNKSTVHLSATFGLVKTIYQETKRLGITHWYAAMEKRLWYSMKKFFAFNLNPVGPELDYYGVVIPYMTSIADLDTYIINTKPHIMEELVAGLEHCYWPEEWKAFLELQDMPYAAFG